VREELGREDHRVHVVGGAQEREVRLDDAARFHDLAEGFEVEVAPREGERLHAGLARLDALDAQDTAVADEVAGALVTLRGVEFGGGFLPVEREHVAGRLAELWELGTHSLLPPYLWIAWSRATSHS